ncbi:MAG: hypothetical protein PVH11_09900 [Anaerolineae bacterium]|jgi:hypothetical protein
MSNREQPRDGPVVEAKNLRKSHSIRFDLQQSGSPSGGKTRTLESLDGERASTQRVTI